MIQQLFYGFILIFFLIACQSGEEVSTDQILEQETLDSATLSEIGYFKTSFLSAWKRSEDYTLKLADAMPAADFQFRPVDSIYTYAEQFTHCMEFSGGQLAGYLTNGDNPFKDRDFEAMSKVEVMEGLEEMYDYVAKIMEDADAVTLAEPINFLGDEIPTWRMFEIINHHNIHHRGQAIIYLRAKGIKPPGFVGW